MSDKKERAEEAEALLAETGMFMIAVRALRKVWFSELMSTVDPLAIQRLTYRLQTLESIPLELSRFINDYKMELKKHG